MHRPSPNSTLSNPHPRAPCQHHDEDQTFVTTLSPRLLLVMLPGLATPDTLLALLLCLSDSVCLSLPLSLLRDYGEGCRVGASRPHMMLRCCGKLPRVQGPNPRHLA